MGEVDNSVMTGQMNIPEMGRDQPPTIGLFKKVMTVIQEDGYNILAWRIIWKFWTILCKLPGPRFIVFWRFTNVTRNIVTLKDALGFAFSRGFASIITPNQVRSEIQALCEVILPVRPGTVLEIGTEHGGTFFLFSRVASADAYLVSVDLPREDLKPWRALCANLARSGQKVIAIDGDSHDRTTVEKVSCVLRHRRVDFLFIDGDHSYEGIRQDFENYATFLNEGAIVAFHDINPDHWTRFRKTTRAYSGGVHKFWDEVKVRYPHTEFIEDPNEDGLGIGVLFIDRSRLNLDEAEREFQSSINH